MWLLLAALTGIFVVFVLPFLVIDWPISVIICVVLYFSPLKVPWVRRWGIWKDLQQRLNYEVVDAEGAAVQIDHQQYVFAVAPHGPFCFSMMLTWIMDNPTSPLTKGRQVVPLVASQVLRLPLLGLLCRMFGGEAITSDNFQYHLGRGHSIAMAPGGAKEIMFCDQDSKTSLTLHKRHYSRWVEFTQINGTRIKPVLSIGENSGYRVFRSWRPLQRLSYRLTGWPFPVFNFGVLNTFWPTQGQLRLVVGEDIKPEDYSTVGDMTDAYYTELERLAAANGITIHYEH